MGYYGWKPYVSVAEKRAKAEKKVAAMKKKGIQTNPVKPEGRTIAKTFWGKSWCSHLESYSDYDNRLPRGRTYIRNGSVIDLDVDKGIIKSMVSGSDIYQVKIQVDALDAKLWDNIVKNCSKQITSVIDLLQGKLSKNVMEIVTDKNSGLFPSPKQLKFSCSCPDWANMCKHVAATLYGFGTRLDETPELLFKLRHVDSQELITVATATKLTEKSTKSKMSTNTLSEMFNIEFEDEKAKSSKPSNLKKETLSKATPAKTAKKVEKEKPIKKVDKKVTKKKEPKKVLAKKVASPVKKKMVKKPVKKTVKKSVKKKPKS